MRDTVEDFFLKLKVEIKEERLKTVSKLFTAMDILTDDLHILVGMSYSMHAHNCAFLSTF